MIRYFLRYPGHPWRFPDGVPDAFAHYQSANWHSILEQMHGFGFGLAIAVAMALLWRRAAPDRRGAPDAAVVRGSPDPAQDRASWAIGFSVWFVWFVIGFLNLHKLVGTWVEGGAVPPTLKAPLLDFFEASPLVWFNIVWWCAAAVCAMLLIVHYRQFLDIVPATWTGKGQLIYVVFLWLVIIGNLNRAILGFSNSRMVTEWILFMNAILATLLIVLLPRKRGAGSKERGGHSSPSNELPTPDFHAPTVESRQPMATPRWPSLTKTWLLGLSAAAALVFLYGYVTLAIYQPHLEGKPRANHRRFGPEAKWRIDPILKHGEHP
jgi:hypothetical protein